MYLIILALALCAVVSGATYLCVGIMAIHGRRTGQWNLDYADRVELNTFHLGLCFILALGFLGLLLRG